MPVLSRRRGHSASLNRAAIPTTSPERTATIVRSHPKPVSRARNVSLAIWNRMRGSPTMTCRPPGGSSASRAQTSASRSVAARSVSDPSAAVFGTSQAAGGAYSECAAVPVPLPAPARAS